MFSYELVQEFKKAKGITKDLEAAELIAGLNSGNMSSIKTGRRKLTEEQALFIANECGLNPQWVLVNLAEETAKSEEAKKAWSNLAKKLSRTVTAAALAVSLVFCGVQDKDRTSAVFV